MRITTPQITAMMHSSMSANSERLGKLLQQMATGERLLLPSDDPVASVRILRVQREEASLEQYRRNILDVSSSLSKQEANLKAISDTMLEVQDLLLWAANLGANASEDLAAIANELSTLEQTIAAFANTRDEEGRYLFSGTQTDRPAIVYDAATGYSLGGNDERRQAAVANGVLVDENVTAAAVFGSDVELLNELRALLELLEDPALDSKDPAVGDQIRATLDSLDRTHRRLLATRTDLGGRQNSLTLLGESNGDVSLVNKRIEGELSQLDYASATIDFNSYLLALQATQKTYLQINQLSLFTQL